MKGKAKQILVTWSTGDSQIKSNHFKVSSTQSDYIHLSIRIILDSLQLSSIHHKSNLNTDTRLKKLYRINVGPIKFLTSFANRTKNSCERIETTRMLSFHKWRTNCSSESQMESIPLHHARLREKKK